VALRDGAVQKAWSNCAQAEAMQFRAWWADRGLQGAGWPAQDQAMSERTTSSPSFGAAVRFRRLRPKLGACLLRLRQQLRCHSQRRLLSEMDARLQRDIGVDPGAVWRETRKWWWQF
jgi:hypothetical protein